MQQKEPHAIQTSSSSRAHDEKHRGLCLQPLPECPRAVTHRRRPDRHCADRAPQSAQDRASRLPREAARPRRSSVPSTGSPHVALIKINARGVKKVTAGGKRPPPQQTAHNIKRRKDKWSHLNPFAAREAWG